MLYLIAGLLCSAMVSIVLKAGGKWEYDKYGMLAVNYAACIVPFLISESGESIPAMDADFIHCLLFAAANGLLYLAGMAMNQVNVRRNGATLQATFSRLGVMVPTCLSVIFFGERPSLRQVAGIVLVLASFCVMNMVRNPENSKSSESKPVFSLLVLGLLLNGMADSMLKVFEETGNGSLDDWFMGATFIFASLICLIIMFIHHGRIGKRELVLGLCLGIPNYLSSLLLLKSLSTVSAYIAYPTYSVGAILVVMAASTLIFKEGLSKGSRICIAMIIPAIILLNF